MTVGQQRGRIFLGRPDEVAFVECNDGFWGNGARQRRWHITKAVTGWRLEFRDPGDDAPTFAGIHATLEGAMREAES